MQINPAVPVPAWPGVVGLVMAGHGNASHRKDLQITRASLGGAGRVWAWLRGARRGFYRTTELRRGTAGLGLAKRDYASQGGFGPLTVHPVPASRDVSRRGESGRGIESHHKELL